MKKWILIMLAIGFIMINPLKMEKATLGGESVTISQVLVPESFALEVEEEEEGVVAEPTGRNIVLRQGDTEAMVNGQPMELPVAPYMVDDRTLIPLRFVSEALGYDVDWEADTRKVTVMDDQGILVEMNIGEINAMVKGAEMRMHVAPEINAASNRTVVPLRFVSETLGYIVEWDEDTHGISITSEVAYEEPEVETNIIVDSVLVPESSVSEAANPVFDTTDMDRGVIHISYQASQESQLRILITKGDQRYTYQLKPDGTIDSFPLQMGNGTYKIDVMQNIGGNRYRFVDSKQVNLELEDPNLVFLNSIQEIRWESEDPPILNSAAMIGDVESKDRQIRTVYDYVIRHYVYDYGKLSRLTSSYLPDIVQTYMEKKGICYDYASLMAAMKRSEEIPVKLVKGYTTHVDEYHAWNEVYLNGEWHVIDTTVDAVYREHGVDYSMIKKPSEYQKVYEY